MQHFLLKAHMLKGNTTRFLCCWTVVSFYHWTCTTVLWHSGKPLWCSRQPGVSNEMLEFAVIGAPAVWMKKLLVIRLISHSCHSLHFLKVWGIYKFTKRFSFMVVRLCIQHHKLHTLLSHIKWYYNFINMQPNDPSNPHSHWVYS